MDNEGSNRVTGFNVVPIFVDITLMVLTGYLSFFLRFGEFVIPSYYHLLIVSASLIAGFAFICGNKYPRTGSPYRYIFNYFLFRVLLAFGIFMMLLVFLKVTEKYSRLWLGYWMSLALFSLFAVHAGYYKVIALMQAKGRMLSEVLIIYTTTEGRDTLTNMALSGYHICREVDLSDDLSDTTSLAALVDSHDVTEVWISMPFSNCASVDKITYELRHSLVNIRFIPQLNAVKLLKHRISYLGSQYAIDLTFTPLDGFNRGVKRLEDLLLATVIGIAIIPVCIAVAIAIKLTSKGPVLFKQKRHGMGGEKINVYKFRSMEVHSEAEGVLTQAEADDPRIPPLGHFLRRTSLDELPQFFNVIQGRMSIVGPRPHALVHNEYYKDLVQSYMWRHKVKPGITGWAQVNGYRGRTDTLGKMRKRVEHDLWYINHWSLLLDLKIILKSCYKGFFHPNAY